MENNPLWKIFVQKKTEKYKELQHDKNSKEYNMWFLKYVPGDIAKNKTLTKSTKRVTQKRKPTAEPNADKESTPENPLFALLRARGA